MALYRALRTLSNGVQRGALTALSGIADADIVKLEQVGAVAKVYAPPLVALPLWRTRAKQLEPHKITTIDQVIEADPAFLATACTITVEDAEKWQKEAAEVLMFRRAERA